MKEDRSGTRDCVHIGARGGMNSDHLHTRAYCQVRGDHSDSQKRRHTSDQDVLDLEDGAQVPALEQPVLSLGKRKKRPIVSASRKNGQIFSRW